MTDPVYIPGDGSRLTVDFLIVRRNPDSGTPKVYSKVTSNGSIAHELRHLAVLDAQLELLIDALSTLTEERDKAWTAVNTTTPSPQFRFASEGKS